MAGFSFTARIFRGQLRGSRDPARSSTRPRLEQLGDRLLLSNISFAGAGIAGPAIRAVLVDLSLGRQLVVAVGKSANLDAARGHAIEQDQAAKAEHRFADAISDSRIRDIIFAASAGMVAGFDPFQGAEFNALRNLWKDKEPATPTEYDLRQLQLSIEQQIGGERSFESAPIGPDGTWRTWSEPIRALIEPNVLVSLLRPYLEERTDRHEADGGSQPTDALADSSGRPDLAGTATVLSERNESAGPIRSLAAIFREQQSDEEVWIEAPAGAVPGLLVSYEPDLPDPQVELLPLEDGGRALVATLVAGVSEDKSSGVSAGTSTRGETLIGSAVGLDSGPEGTDQSDEPIAAAPAPTGAVPAPVGLSSPARDAALGTPKGNGRPEVGEASRPAICLLEALCAARLFHIYGRPKPNAMREPRQRLTDADGNRKDRSIAQDE